MDWKYIARIDTGVWPVPLDKHWGSAGSGQKPFLFNLRTDPTESYNLRDDHADIIVEMDATFREWDAAMAANRGGWR